MPLHIIHVISDFSYRDICNAASALYLAISKHHPSVRQSFISLKSGILGNPNVPFEVSNSTRILDMCNDPNAVVILHKNPDVDHNLTRSWVEKVPVIISVYHSTLSPTLHRVMSCHSLVVSCDAVYQTVKRFTVDKDILIISPAISIGKANFTKKDQNLEAVAN